MHVYKLCKKMTSFFFELFLSGFLKEPVKSKAKQHRYKKNITKQLFC
jgi:hypothetical protein